MPETPISFGLGQKIISREDRNRAEEIIREKEKKKKSSEFSKGGTIGSCLARQGNSEKNRDLQTAHLPFIRNDRHPRIAGKNIVETGTKLKQARQIQIKISQKQVKKSQKQIKHLQSKVKKSQRKARFTETNKNLQKQVKKSQKQ